MILINDIRKYQFADSLAYVIEKYKEGGSGVTVRKNTIYIPKACDTCNLLSAESTM